MIGSIGIDLQDTRAAACLLEWPDQGMGRGVPRQGVIGDGRRLLFPVAATAADGEDATGSGGAAGSGGMARSGLAGSGLAGSGGAADGLWGSAAAEAILARAGSGARPGPRGAAGSAAALAAGLHQWRSGPWTAEFLDGLRRRLLRYLGQPETGPVRSHLLSVCADPGPDGDWGHREQALEEAGLGGAELVRPADALLCRWLAGNPDLSRTRTVLAVACGEAVTELALFTVQGTQEAIARMDRARVAAGPDAWLADLAAAVLRVCRPDTPARGLLALLDGADEFAAALRAGVLAPDARAEWSGPMSQHMFEPYRASRAELAAQPSVAGWTVPVGDAAARLVAGAPGPVTALVGGPGAAWPFVADLLAVTLGAGTRRASALDGGVWGSGDPALDLAFGACWWPLFKRAFNRIPTAVAPARLAGAVMNGSTAGRVGVSGAGAPRGELAAAADAPPPWADDTPADTPPWADDAPADTPADAPPWADDASPAADAPPWSAAGNAAAEDGTAGQPGIGDDGPPWQQPPRPAQAAADLPPWER
jgi:hypothetical protein